VRVVRDPLHLLGGDLRQLGAAVTDVDAPKARHRVEIGGAVMIDDRGTLRASDHDLVLLQHAMLDDRMQDAVEVLLDGGFADFRVRRIGEGHLRFFLSADLALCWSGQSFGKPVAAECLGRGALV
jgi:hypothetical protein